jgi:signal transduction histidine kinase
MSFGMRRDEPSIGDPADTASEERDRFFANLSQGLHAMGQPLTVMRGAVAASVAQGVTQENQQRYLKMLADQTAVACGLYHCLREIVAASQFAADCAPVDLLQLLSPVVEEQRAALQGSGVAIEVIMPRGLRPILADRDRTLQALFAVLKIAASVSSSGDVIELQLTHSHGAVVLTVRNKRSQGKSLNSLERLSLALAEANIRSQQGGYDFVEDPFCVSLTLSAGEIDARTAQGAFQDELARQVH